MTQRMDVEDLFDYVDGIEDSLGYDGYSTNEEREEWCKAFYDELARMESEEGATLGERSDDEIGELLEVLEDRNYHVASTALIAYLHAERGFVPEGGIEREIEYAPFLYED